MFAVNRTIRYCTQVSCTNKRNFYVWSIHQPTLQITRKYDGVTYDKHMSLKLLDI